MVLFRGIARLVGAALMVVAALTGLGLALYCVDALIKLGAVRPDRLIHLRSYSRDVGRFLMRLAAPGATAWLAAFGALVAMLLALAVLAGTLRTSRRRLALLARQPDHGRVAARPRVLGQISRYLAIRADGVTDVKRARVSVARSPRHGRLTVRVVRTRTSDEHAVRDETAVAMRAVTVPFELRPRVSTRVAEGRSRVQ